MAMGLQKVDLNLFALFSIMMRHRSVTTASRELGVTPSAVSHGLARLRRLLRDELFVAAPEGMVPTSRALELAPGIRDGLGQLAVALEQRHFDPAVSSRAFAMACGDYIGEVLLPPVLGRVIRQAPDVHIKVFPVNRLDVVQQLDEDRLHIVFGWFDTLPPRIHRHPLWIEHGVFVVRQGHPLTQCAVTDEQLLRFPHAVVDFSGTASHAGDGFVDDRGVRRRIWIDYLILTSQESNGPVGRAAVTVPYYSVIPSILRASDMVATMPAQLARRAIKGEDGLVILQRDDAGFSVQVEMIWHDRAIDDPGLQWLLQLVQDAALEVRRE